MEVFGEFNKIKVEARKWSTGKVRLVARPQVGAGYRPKFQGESKHLWSCYGALKYLSVGKIVTIGSIKKHV